MRIIASKIHYRGDLSAANVIVWNGVDYNIKFIADNGPKEVYMYIDAERGVQCEHGKAAARVGQGKQAAPHTAQT